MIAKIMTSNVWADVFGNPVKGRDDNLSVIYKRYMPDVICFQEMHPHWHESSVPVSLKENGYIETKPDISPNELNYTPLYYRNARFTEIESGFHLFTGPNDFNSKSVTWVLLKSQEDGKLIGAMATHLYFEENEKGNQARIQNCKEIFELADMLKEKGAESVFCGGDMNCSYLHEPLMMLKEKGMISAAELCSMAEEYPCSWHEEPRMDENGVYHGKKSDYPNSWSLDHVLVLGGAACTSYMVINDEEALAGSDHSPVMATFEI